MAHFHGLRGQIWERSQPKYYLLTTYFALPQGSQDATVAAHDPDQRCRSTATKSGPWHLTQDGLEHRSFRDRHHRSQRGRARLPPVFRLVNTAPQCTKSASATVGAFMPIADCNCPPIHARGLTSSAITGRWSRHRYCPDRFNRAVGSGDDQARNSAGRTARLTRNCPSGQLHASILSPFMGVCITQGPIRPWQRSRSCRPVVGLLLGGTTKCAPKS